MIVFLPFTISTPIQFNCQMLIWEIKVGATVFHLYQLQINHKPQKHVVAPTTIHSSEQSNCRPCVSPTNLLFTGNEELKNRSGLVIKKETMIIEITVGCSQRKHKNRIVMIVLSKSR